MIIEDGRLVVVYRRDNPNTVVWSIGLSQYKQPNPRRAPRFFRVLGPQGTQGEGIFIDQSADERVEYLE